MKEDFKENKDYFSYYLLLACKEESIFLFFANSVYKIIFLIIFSKSNMVEQYLFFLDTFFCWFFLLFIKILCNRLTSLTKEYKIFIQDCPLTWTKICLSTWLFKSKNVWNRYTIHPALASSFPIGNHLILYSFLIIRWIFQWLFDRHWKPSALCLI